MPTKEITRKTTFANQHGINNTQAMGSGSSRERRMKRGEEAQDLTSTTSVTPSGNIVTPEKKMNKEHSSPRSISAFPGFILRANRVTDSTARRTSSSDSLFLPLQAESTAASDRVIYLVMRVAKSSLAEIMRRR